MHGIRRVKGYKGHTEEDIVPNRQSLPPIIPPTQQFQKIIYTLKATMNSAHLLLISVFVLLCSSVRVNAIVDMTELAVPLIVNMSSVTGFLYDPTTDEAYIAFQNPTDSTDETYVVVIYE